MIEDRVRILDREITRGVAREGCRPVYGSGIPVDVAGTASTRIIIVAGGIGCRDRPAVIVVVIGNDTVGHYNS